MALAAVVRTIEEGKRWWLMRRIGGGGCYGALQGHSSGTEQDVVALWLVRGETTMVFVVARGGGPRVMAEVESRWYAAVHVQRVWLEVSNGLAHVH